MGKTGKEIRRYDAEIIIEIILQVRCLVLHNSISTIDLLILLRYNLIRKEGRK